MRGRAGRRGVRWRPPPPLLPSLHYPLARAALSAPSRAGSVRGGLGLLPGSVARTRRSRCSRLAMSHGATVAWKPPPADTISCPRFSQPRVPFPAPCANKMAEGSRGSWGGGGGGELSSPAGELEALQKEPGGGEQMASPGKGTQRLALGGLLDPVRTHGLERRRLGGAVAGTQDH